MKENGLSNCWWRILIIFDHKLLILLVVSLLGVDIVKLLLQFGQESQQLLMIRSKWRKLIALWKEFLTTVPLTRLPGSQPSKLGRTEKTSQPMMENATMAVFAIGSTRSCLMITLKLMKNFKMITSLLLFISLINGNNS